MLKSLRLFLLTLLAVGTLMGTSVGSASAAEEKISRDQVLAIPDKATAEWTPIGGFQVQLRYGTYNGTQYAWAKLDNYPSDRQGDIWLESSSDSGANWVTRSIYSTTVSNFTEGIATRSSSSFVMRACYRGPETNKWCTDKW
ncbi:hypothetical protein O3Q52_17930 [Streptomyces sp. ActVer]|uniref:hypothetical protein n=1 Tax=Streptomyces sp. ActVer TaxID=3014558 RepID=UPI0022B2ACCF|nr:hypothetical protein [Streptomyces sp. ActVer]MCZ4510040.1 hypothetical protein [Streptomyces sp. ActVer]